MQPERAYYPYFDYLRAAAALGVFVGHADVHHVFPEQLGFACVQIFFALSGFLIGGILLRSKPGDMPRFYFNRATRIWIPYAIAICLLAAVTGIKQGFHDPKFSEFFFYMATFTYNWFGPPQLAEFVHRMPLDGTGNHFWSICVEEQFYLVAPFVIVLLPRAFLWCGLAAASYLSPDYFAAISLGVAVAVIGPDLPKGEQTTIGRIAGGASYSFYLNSWLGLFAMSAAMKYGASYPAGWVLGLSTAVAFSVGHYFAVDRMIAANRSKWFFSRLGAALCLVGFALVIVGLIGGALYRG